MRVAQTLIAVVWCGGVACLLAAIVTSARNRRSEVPLARLWSAGSDVGVHPERYVVERAVALVRGLNVAGLSLCVLSVVSLVGWGLLQWTR
jgi:hypothetical protein